MDVKDISDNPSGTLVFDIETHSADLFWSMPPERFVRIMGFKWMSDDQVTLTTDLNVMRWALLKARWIVGHNIHHFDLPAVFGVYSDIPLTLAMKGRVYDTWTHAVLVHPAPYQYINRKGVQAFGDTPERMKAWFSLDEQAHQLGVPGKTHDLKELAKEFGPKVKGMGLKERVSQGYGLIPVDDERYREYLTGDVLASERVAQELLKKGSLNEYAMREQELEARAFVIRSNGFKVDAVAAQARVDELADARDAIMEDLIDRYDFPSEGKAPWATKEGKEAILKALDAYGINETNYPDWPRTGTGAVQLGGEVLLELTKGTKAEALGKALAELKGQRSLAQLALDSMYPDGFCHPSITMLQRSGRWSTTEPGLTVWTANGDNKVEKSYFVPDNEDHVLLEIDLSNADARVVAWLSGDFEYAKRFEPGADGHLINAWAAWGKDVVGTDKHDPTTHAYRQKAKPLGHGWNYGGRAKTLALQSGLPFEDADTFCTGMDKAFWRIVKWQNRVRAFAKKHGYVMSEWGRKLYVEKGREFTQAPALLGQNGTREIMADAILAMSIPALRTVKGSIHDALVFSVPKDKFEAAREYFVNIMSSSHKAPAGGLDMDFPAEAGPAGDNWLSAGH